MIRCGIFGHKWEIKTYVWMDYRGTFGRFLASQPNKKRVCKFCKKEELFNDIPIVKTPDEIRDEKIDKLLN